VHFIACGQLGIKDIRSDLSHFAERVQFGVGGGTEVTGRDGGGEITIFTARAAAVTTAP